MKKANKFFIGIYELELPVAIYQKTDIKRLILHLIIERGSELTKANYSGVEWLESKQAQQTVIKSLKN